MSLKSKVRGSSQGEAQSNVGSKTQSAEPFDQTLFQAGVIGYLRTINQLPKDGDVSKHEALTQAIDLFEIHVGKAASSYGNAVEALIAFKSWLDTAAYEYKKPQTFVANTINVSVTMSTPSGSLTVGLSVEPLVSDIGRVIRDAKDMLEDEIRKTFVGKERGKLNAPKANENEDKEPEIESVTCDTLRVQYYEKKTYYYAMPTEGKWVKFGIPLYKDIAKKFSVELPTEEGEFDIDWLVAYELKEDGKPRRVIEITDASEEA